MFRVDGIKFTGSAGGSKKWRMEECCEAREGARKGSSGDGKEIIRV